MHPFTCLMFPSTPWLHDIVFKGNSLHKFVEQQTKETETPLTIVVGGHVGKV